MQSNESLVAEWTRATSGYMSSTGRRKLASRLWKRIRQRVKTGTLNLEDHFKPKKRASLLTKLRER